eukprot:5282577-Alexandrium_andersonii.AAC.1
MALAGWGDEDWAKPLSDGDFPLTDDLLISLAGNAFSAFACGPVCASAIVAVGACLPSASDLGLASQESQASEAADESESD